MMASASGWVSFQPLPRRRRASSAAVKIVSRSISVGVRRMRGLLFEFAAAYSSPPLLFEFAAAPIVGQEIGRPARAQPCASLGEARQARATRDPTGAGGRSPMSARRIDETPVMIDAEINAPSEW